MDILVILCFIMASALFFIASDLLYGTIKTVCILAGLANMLAAVVFIIRT